MIRTGVDLIEIERLEQVRERYGERFLQRVFTVGELKDCQGQAQSLAARYAAKEAAAKALGVGIGAVAWREIEVIRGEQREPALVLHGKAAQLAQQLGLRQWAVSLSHSQTHAIAVVFATGD